MRISVVLRNLTVLAILAGAGVVLGETASVSPSAAWKGSTSTPVAPTPTAAADEAAGGPEPSIYTLVLAGVGAAGWLLRRRRRDDR